MLMDSRKKIVHFKICSKIQKIFMDSENNENIQKCLGITNIVPKFRKMFATRKYF